MTNRDTKRWLATEAHRVTIDRPDASSIYDRRHRIVRRQRHFATGLGLGMTALLVVGLLAFSARLGDLPAVDEPGAGSVEFVGQFRSAASNATSLVVLTCTDSCEDPSASQGALTGVEVATGNVMWDIDLANPGKVAVDSQNAWTIGFANSTVSKIDLQSGVVEASAQLELHHPIGSDVAFLPTEMSVDSDTVWIASARGELVGLDKGTLAVAADIQIPAKASGGLAAFGGTVWFGGLPTGIDGVDPETGHPGPSLAVSNGTDRLVVNGLASTGDRVIAVGTWGRHTPDGSDWELTGEAGAAIIDPASGLTETEAVALGSTLVTGADQVWVCERDGGLLIANSTGFVRQPSQDGQVVAVTTEDFWVLSQAGELSPRPR